MEMQGDVSPWRLRYLVSFHTKIASSRGVCLLSQRAVSNAQLQLYAKDILAALQERSYGMELAQGVSVEVE